MTAARPPHSVSPHDVMWLAASLILHPNSTIPCYVALGKVLSCESSPSHLRNRGKQNHRHHLVAKLGMQRDKPNKTQAAP